MCAKILLKRKKIQTRFSAWARLYGVEPAPHSSSLTCCRLCEYDRRELFPATIYALDLGREVGLVAQAQIKNLERDTGRLIRGLWRSTKLFPRRRPRFAR